MKLLILDGNSVINRAYFGVKPLTNRDGLYTHAIFGFLNILERMQKEEQPDAVAVAFDLHGPTFRHKKYDGYKATRHPMPEELAQQMPSMKQVLQAWTGCMRIWKMLPSAPNCGRSWKAVGTRRICPMSWQPLCRKPPSILPPRMP